MQHFKSRDKNQIEAVLDVLFVGRNARGNKYPKCHFEGNIVTMYHEQAAYFEWVLFCSFPLHCMCFLWLLHFAPTFKDGPFW